MAKFKAPMNSASKTGELNNILDDLKATIADARADARQELQELKRLDKQGRKSPEIKETQEYKEAVIKKQTAEERLEGLRTYKEKMTQQRKDIQTKEKEQEERGKRVPEGEKPKEKEQEERGKRVPEEKKPIAKLTHQERLKEINEYRERSKRTKDGDYSAIYHMSNPVAYAQFLGMKWASTQVEKGAVFFGRRAAAAKKDIDTAKGATKLAKEYQEGLTQELIESRKRLEALQTLSKNVPERAKQMYESFREKYPDLPEAAYAREFNKAISGKAAEELSLLEKVATQQQKLDGATKLFKEKTGVIARTKLRATESLAATSAAWAQPGGLIKFAAAATVGAVLVKSIFDKKKKELQGRQQVAEIRGNNQLAIYSMLISSGASSTRAEQIIKVSARLSEERDRLRERYKETAGIHRRLLPFLFEEISAEESKFIEQAAMDLPMLEARMRTLDYFNPRSYREKWRNNPTTQTAIRRKIMEENPTLYAAAYYTNMDDETFFAYARGIAKRTGVGITPEQAEDVLYLEQLKKNVSSELTRRNNELEKNKNDPLKRMERQERDITLKTANETHLSRYFNPQTF